MPKAHVKSQLRLPHLLKTQLEDACKTSGRSMNAEIVYRLARSLVGIYGGRPEDDEKLLDAMSRANVYHSDESDDQLLARQVALLAGLTEHISAAVTVIQGTLKNKKSPSSKPSKARRKKT